MTEQTPPTCIERVVSNQARLQFCNAEEYNGTYYVGMAYETLGDTDDLLVIANPEIKVAVIVEQGRPFNDVEITDNTKIFKVVSHNLGEFSTQHFTPAACQRLRNKFREQFGFLQLEPLSAVEAGRVLALDARTAEKFCKELVVTTDNCTCGA